MKTPARFTITPAEQTAVRAEMYAVLIDCARRRETITYSDVAQRIDTAYLHPGSYTFLRILGSICQEEDDAGRGLICALVVSKLTGIPGGGFFRALAGYGRDTSDAEAAWREECERVFAAWADEADEPA